MKQEIKNRIEQINNGIVPNGYKKTTVGICPNEWDEYTLGDFLEFKNGLNKEKEAFGSGTPIINYTDVWGKRGLYSKDIKGRVNLTAKEISNFNVREGDVFFTRTSEVIEEIGFSSVLLEPIDDAVFSGFVLRARPKNDMVVKEYHQYCYSSNDMRKEIQKRSSMTTRALTSGTMLSQVCVNIPSKAEQSKIAEILMKWDDAIALQEQYIQKLEERKKALIQRIIKKQNGWSPVKLNDILTERKIYASKDSDYIHVTLCKEGVVDKTAQYDRDFLVVSDEKEYKITYKGDIVYNPANLKFGVISINKYENPAIFSPIYVTFEITDGYNIDFIGAILCDNSFINYIRKYEEGSIYERQAVKPDDFLKGIIYVPSKKEQDKMADILFEIDEEISLQKEKLEQLKKQRKAMQQYLLTGIVRV